MKSIIILLLMTFLWTSCASVKKVEVNKTYKGKANKRYAKHSNNKCDICEAYK